jgi:hypothetical protein
MGHVFFGARLLRAGVIASVLFALCLTGSAGATTTTSSEGEAVCSPNPGSCTFSGNAEATFAGQFNTPAVVIDQSLCPAQAADPADTICGHFGIDTTSVQGTITVGIAFNADDDLDLCVVRGAPPAATLAAPCSTGVGATETVTFTVVCGDTHFEAQILPISFPFPGPTPLTPSRFTGTVTANLNACVGAGQVPPPPADAQREVDGGGKLTNATTPDASFAVDVERESNGALEGKVRISTNGCDFRGRNIDSAEFDDANKTTVIHGRGTFKGSSTLVPFNATAHDGGPNGSNDTFTIDKCSTSSRVAEGDVRYRVERN